MTEFTSVWEEAGYSVEEEQAQRSLAQAKVASASIWPFLALAADEAEFGQRLDLAGDTLSTAASAHGVEVADLVTVYTREYGLLAESRKTAADSHSECPDHSDQSFNKSTGDCSCGSNHKRWANSNNPGGQKSSGKLPDALKEHVFKAADETKDDDEDETKEASRHTADSNSNLAPEGYHYPEEDDQGERTAAERWGPYEDDKGDAGDAQDRHYDGDYGYSRHGSLAMLKKALEEGEDPLSWVGAEDGGQAQPEKPVEAGIEAAGTEVPADTQPPALGSRHPFAHEGAGFLHRCSACNKAVELLLNSPDGERLCGNCMDKFYPGTGGAKPEPDYKFVSGHESSRSRHPFALGL